MKLTKLVLRIYIAISSVVGFLVGWILLAHSGKPAAAGTVDAAILDQPAATASFVLPTPAPIPSLEQLTGGATAVQPLQPLPQLPPSGFVPRLRSRGS